MQNLSQQLTDTLKKQFNFDSFRPGQLEAITSLMTHGRLICIQPTGHGKSLLYQLPATILDGITIVISPLLALMRDQLSQLKNRFGIAAASINTDQTDQENFAARQAALTGKIRILFIAPEQLNHTERFQFLIDLPIKLLVIDEAHCISTWGHDFRPSYRQIIELVRSLANKSNDLKILALTATADDKTEVDIKQQLSIDKKEIIIHRESMHRPNITLSVIPASGLADKMAQLSHLLGALTGCGLIYCATRENTELVAEYLSGQGIVTTAYHAGIEASKKLNIQNNFIHDQYQVISATNALGMGIDKPNLRYIIHFDFPGSITAYYQEVGRAGRDGQPAEGILLYDPADTRIQSYFIESSQPSVIDFQVVLNTMTTTKVSCNLQTLKRLTGLHPTRLSVILAELIEQKFLIKTNQQGSQVYQLIKKSGKPDFSRYAVQLETRRKELKNMQRYAEQSKKCLMLILRKALGDHGKQSCGKCNVCTNNFVTPKNNKDSIIAISSWLERRTIPISLSKKIKSITSGMAVLDGKLRSSMFIQFMQERAQNMQGLTNELTQLIKNCFMDLSQHYKFSCIIPLPSRTWLARTNVAQSFANHLNIPALIDLLAWKDTPESRQGELLNNDQRQHNVSNKMQINRKLQIPQGVILLLDDYTGSGATLNEAARVLREQYDHEIMPFTIASIKWRLGNRGMI